MDNYHRTLYRARRGKIFGVFQGLANYTGLDAFWLRFFAIILMFFSGILPMVIAYIVAALLMKLEPPFPLEPQGEEFYNCVASNRRLALMRLSSRLDSLDRRAQRLETIVTARGSDWDRRMNEAK
jgi:phage shock protein C